MSQLHAACSIPQEPSEGQKLLGTRKVPRSAGFWRTIHLAALGHSVRTIQAVQEV